MTEWQKLDPKMLLLGPVEVLKQFLIPAIAALIGFGTQRPEWLLIVAPLVVLSAVGFGALPWLTTRFQVTGTQLVVTRGLLNKTRLTAPMDRIRSVDLEATLMHRVLGLQKVQVGTGVDDTMIELNSLSVAQASQLRTVLLARAAVPAQTQAPATDGDPFGPATDAPPPGPAAVPDTEIARLSTGWSRFAPFSLGRLVIVLGALGGLWQLVGEINIDTDRGGELWDRVIEGSIILLLVGVVVGALVLWTLVAVAAYLVQWWDMRLVREGENLRLTRGLFTTTSTTIEEKRIRGVQLRETALLRTVGGGELHALVTGLEQSVYAVLPTCPVGVATDVAEEITGDRAPLTVRLRQHGPRARRRCHVRGGLSVLPLVAAVWILTVLLEPAMWLPVAATAVLVVLAPVFAELAYAKLGHALTAHHLVAGTGITARTRTVLERNGIIGWVITQTWFQRRHELATLVATTAAGSEKVTLLDVPLPIAVALADDTTPGVLAEFLA